MYQMKTMVSNEFYFCGSDNQLYNNIVFTKVIAELWEYRNITRNRSARATNTIQQITLYGGQAESDP